METGISLGEQSLISGAHHFTSRFPFHSENVWCSLLTYQVRHALKGLAVICLPLSMFIPGWFLKYYQNFSAITYSLLLYAFLHIFPQSRIHSLLSCPENCIPSSKTSFCVNLHHKSLVDYLKLFPLPKILPTIYVAGWI